MSDLNDRKLREVCTNGLLQPFDEEMLNPASVDVRLGTTLMIEPVFSGDGYLAPEYIEIDISGCTSLNPYWVAPQQFLLAETLEVFYMPDNLVGEFRMKSSRAREGLGHLLAVWIDPGFWGSRLTLELFNHNRWHSVPIYPGMRIGQIVLRPCEPPERSYRVTGRYCGDMKVTASKG